MSQSSFVGFTIVWCKFSRLARATCISIVTCILWLAIMKFVQVLKLNHGIVFPAGRFSALDVQLWRWIARDCYVRLTLSLAVVVTWPAEFLAVTTYSPSSSGYVSAIVRLCTSPTLFMSKYLDCFIIWPLASHVTAVMTSISLQTVDCCVFYIQT